MLDSPCSGVHTCRPWYTQAVASDLNVNVYGAAGGAKDGEQGPMLASGMQAPLRASYNILNQDIIAENSRAARKLRQNMDSSSKTWQPHCYEPRDVGNPKPNKLHY